MLADLVVASEDAFFRAAFSRLGLVADYALAFTLPQLVGDQRAADILLQDRRIPASEALELGLVSRTFPASTFADEAREFGLALARSSRGAQLTKRLLRWREAEALKRYLELEAVTQAEAFQTRDHSEGVAAFMEKRSPSFEGR